MPVNFDLRWHEKGHRVEYHVPGITILGLTLRRPYIVTIWVACEQGESLVDKAAASIFAPNPLFNWLIRNTEAESGH